jgi:hypothetical protein
MPRGSQENSSSASIEGTIDRLYSLDPDEFTKERDEATKRLREQGDREGSSLVKGLRRPTVAAWAVNQLPRRRPDLVAELLEAGSALRAAQRVALSGSKRGDLREVSERRRAAVAVLMDEAADALRDAGRDPAPHADAIRSTLEAASADEAIGELVRTGRLTKEAEPPSGLGDVSPFEVLPGGRDATPRGSGAAESAADRRFRERLETRVVKAEATLTTARETAAAARQEAEAAAKDVDRLERELRTAQRRADRASKAASAAKDRADEAARALAQAQADLEA